MREKWEKRKMEIKKIDTEEYNENWKIDGREKKKKRKLVKNKRNKEKW